MHTLDIAIIWATMIGKNNLNNDIFMFQFLLDFYTYSSKPKQ
jgi:hypothetical protein